MVNSSNYVGPIRNLLFYRIIIFDMLHMYNLDIIVEIFIIFDREIKFKIPLYLYV